MYPDFSVGRSYKYKLVSSLQNIPVANVTNLALSKRRVNQARSLFLDIVQRIGGYPLGGSLWLAPEGRDNFLTLPNSFRILTYYN